MFKRFKHSGERENIIVPIVNRKLLLDGPSIVVIHNNKFRKISLLEALGIKILERIYYNNIMDTCIVSIDKLSKKYVVTVDKCSKKIDLEFDRGKLVSMDVFKEFIYLKIPFEMKSRYIKQTLEELNKTA